MMRIDSQCTDQKLHRYRDWTLMQGSMIEAQMETEHRVVDKGQQLGYWLVTDEWVSGRPNGSVMIEV